MFHSYRIGGALSLALAVAPALALGGCEIASWFEPGETLSKEIISTSLSSAANSAESSGDFRSAMGHYRTLYERSPKDRALALKLARAMRLAGEVRQAATLLEQFNRTNGADGDSRVELAKAYMASDQLALSKRNLAEARTLAPKNWEVPSLLGVIHDYEGDSATARVHYDIALALSPDNPNILNNLGLSMAMAGDLDGAIDVLHKAKDQVAASPHIRQNLALLLAMKGDVAGAERFSRKDMSPDMIRANLRYFRALADGAKNY